AMAYAHARGVIHRDLKPANVMVGAFGEVQVMDWGFAKQLATPDSRSPAADPPAEPDAGTAPWPPTSSGDRPAAPGPSRAGTRHGAVLGTPAYMPPEQARGEAVRIDARADVFALGAILCEILTGRPPYSGGSAYEVCRQAAAGNLGDAFAALDGCGAD